MTKDIDALTVALSAIKVIAATVKAPDAPRALAHIMVIARWAGIEAPYSELQKDERVAFVPSDAPASERRAALAQAPAAEPVPACDCPCHDGIGIMHVLPCCNSGRGA